MDIEDCIITDYSPENLHRHKQRVLSYKKRISNSPKVNHIKDFIEGRVDYTKYLPNQHQSIVDECNELFLFTDNDIFLETNAILSNETGHPDIDKAVRDIEHENEHLEKAKRHGCECYIGIRFNFTQIAPRKWSGNTTPTMIPFVEKIAISERWSLKKYIGVLEDIINVSNMSEGDLKTLRTIQAMKSLI